MQYHSPGLRFEAVSEDSQLEADLGARSLPSPPLYYSPPVQYESQLPAFPVYDAEWVSGGVSEDRVYTTNARGLDWSPEFSSPETHRIKRPKISDRERKGDGLGGIVSEKEKRKRIKMLEKEFGTIDAKALKRQARQKRRQEKETPGYVDSRGRITTQGKRKRALLRWTEGILALASIIGSAGVLFVCFSFRQRYRDCLHPTFSQLTHPRDVPPPRGTIPALIMYALGPITLIATLWIFVFGPCCAPLDRNDASNPNLADILPIVSGSHAYGKVNGKDRSCCGGKRKRVGDDQRLQVNLIVDPNMLAAKLGFEARKEQNSDAKQHKAKKKRKTGDDHSYTEGDSDSSSISIASSFRVPSEDAEQTIGGNFLDRLGRQERDRRAKKRLMHIVVFDGVSSLLWFVESAWAIFFGEKCAPGAHAGWCDGYNSALACGFFLFLAFGTSTILDIRDLKHMKDRRRLSSV